MLLRSRKKISLAILLQLIFLIQFSQAQSTDKITGRVLDQRGNAVASANVTVSPANVTAAKITAVTDGEGRFAVEMISPAELAVDAAGFGPYRKTLSPATDQHLEIVLLPAEINASVNVTRTASGVDDSPASIVVVGRRKIETTPAQTLDDKLRQVPGFSLFRRAGSRTANPTAQGVSLRGVGASGASRALVLADGVPINDPFGGWVYWGRVPVESIESVEVLRGTAGDLYGSSAVGGVVSARTQDDNARRLSIETSYGSEATPQVSAFGSGNWHQIGGSLAVEGFRTDGFIAVAPEFRGPVDTASDSKRLAIVPRLRYSASGLDVFLKATFYGERRNNGTPLQDNDTRLREFVAGLDHDARSFGTLSVRAYFLGQVYDQSFSAVAADRRTESLSRLQRVPSESFASSLVWRKLFGSGLQIFSGAEARVVRGRSDETGFANGRAASLLSTGGREFTFGVFGGGQFKMGDRITLSGGLRYDRWRNYSGFNATRSLITNVFGLQTFPDRTQEAVSPRISVLFIVTPNVSVSSAYSSGFRQPTLNELYRSFRVGDVVTNANAGLMAERARTFESAVTFYALHDKFRARAGFFITRIEDPVSNVTLSITPSLITRQRQNMGRAVSRGIEVDGDSKINADFSLSGGYLFADSRVASFPADPALVGLRIPQIPRHQLTLSLNFSRPSIATVSVHLRAASTQFDDDQNRFPLRGFYTLDLLGSRRITKNFSIFAAVENLFDRAVEAGRTPVLTLASPRSARVGIRLNFGSK